MDIDNANCKLRVSECTDVIESYAIERPLKIDREISGLEKLLEELHAVFSHEHVNVHDVQALLAGYRSEPKDWRKYAKFDRFRYTRHLVDAGNGAFNVMVLCWGAGQASAIHDHADSHCFMKLLAGSLEEIRYDWPENLEPEVRKAQKTGKPVRRCCSESEDIDSCQNSACQRQSDGAVGSEARGKQDGDGLASEMVEIGRTRLDVNDVCYINDALGLHRMENPSPVEGAVSLHLYSPPFDACRVFDSRTGAHSRVHVTFTTVYGRRVPRVIEAVNVADSQQ